MNNRICLQISSFKIKTGGNLGGSLLSYAWCAALIWLLSKEPHASSEHQNPPKCLLSFSPLSVAHNGPKRHGLLPATSSPPGPCWPVKSIVTTNGVAGAHCLDTSVSGFLLSLPQLPYPPCQDPFPEGRGVSIGRSCLLPLGVASPEILSILSPVLFCWPHQVKLRRQMKCSYFLISNHLLKLWSWTGWTRGNSFTRR